MTHLSTVELPSNVETAQRNAADLVAMLTYMRPDGSEAEQEFIARWLAPLGCTVDEIGNYILQIGSAPILWSSHTDTVHAKPGRQTVDVATVVTAAKDGKGSFTDRVVSLSKRSKKGESTCLGADDTAGVWLMREMILAKKPGMYIFHRGEERGAHGSSFIAKHTPGLLAGIQAAIALDRMGYVDVITHQAAVRTASDEFAASIAAQLGMGYRACAAGIFTDTAEYAALVPECSNLSVGYFAQHSVNESLNLDHVLDLRERLLALDYDKLVYKRAALDPMLEWQDEYESCYARGARGCANATSSRQSWGGWSGDLWDTDAPANSQATMADIVAENPDEIADWLEHLGYSVQDAIEAVYDRRQA